ncbi:MAG: protein kinase domain-containing protein [Elusimicrobiota bacterium]
MYSKTDNQIISGRYKVLEKIGEGGMSVVWKVYDCVEEKDIVLKEIKLGYSEYKKQKKEQNEIAYNNLDIAEADYKFMDEFVTMKKLQHPYIVKVFNYGTCGNASKYITMELVEGKTINCILQEKSLSTDEIIKVLAQLSQVLNFIHSRIFVHRDIKSENIMLKNSGDICLLDFGLMDRIGVVSEGTMTGTVQYTPPEVFKGGVINESSDLYSMGILAYELVAGRPPFEGDDVLEIARMHISEAPEALARIRGDIPSSLEDIINKLLEKKQSERYQRAYEVLEDLSELKDNTIIAEPVEARKSYLYCTELIGREKEIARLEQAIEKIKSGKGDSIFIGAPAGTGKSRLVQEFKIKAQLSEVIFAEGFCVQGGMAAYQPFKSIIKALVAVSDKVTLDKYGDVLAKILPQLENSGYEPLIDDDPVSEKIQIYKAVSSFLNDISKEHAIVICIEDLHWADFATIGLLNACIRQSHGTHLVFLGAFRDDEIEKINPVYLTIQEGLSCFMKISPLNKKNTVKLVKKMLGKVELTDEFANQLFEVTAGNPFFIYETMRILIIEDKIKIEHGIWHLPAGVAELKIPHSIEATVMRRLNFLSEKAYEFMEVSSVVGKEINLFILQKLTGFNEKDLFEIIDELVEKQFIEKKHKSYYFTHDRIRETLYSRIEKDKKSTLHDSIGNIIEDKFKNNLSYVAIRLAVHFSKGKDKEKAVRYLLMATELSYEKDLILDTIEFFKQAVQNMKAIDYKNNEIIIIETFSKIIKAGQADPKFTVDILEESLEFLNSMFNIQHFVKLLRVVFKIINLLPKNLSRKIKNKIQNSSSISEFKKDRGAVLERIILLQNYLCIAYGLCGQNDELFNQAEKLYAMLPDPNSYLKAMYYIPRCIAFANTDQMVFYEQEAGEAMKLFEPHEKYLDKNMIYLYGISCFLSQAGKENQGGQLEIDIINKAMSIAEDNNFYDLKYWVLNCMSVHKQYHGLYDEFESIKERLLDILNKMGNPVFLEINYYDQIAWINIARGNFVQAERWAEKMKLSANKIGNVARQARAEYTYGWLYMEKGDCKRAIDILKNLVSFCSKPNIPLEPLTQALYRLATAYLEVGDLQNSIKCLKQARNRAANGKFENRYHMIFVYRIFCEVFIKQKKYEEALENIEESLKIAIKDNNPIQQGKTYLVYAKLNIEITKYTAAEKCLKLAVKKFTEIDNKFYISRAEKVRSRLNQLKRRNHYG